MAEILIQVLEFFHLIFLIIRDVTELKIFRVEMRNLQINIALKYVLFQFIGLKVAD